MAKKISEKKWAGFGRWTAVSIGLIFLGATFWNQINFHLVLRGVFSFFGIIFIYAGLFK